ncbi:MAG TPA: PQQ-binding-like beta-propeller repeat protein [Thermoanaerobaculia bacterium]|nr:PQQ-binding-like beta-propeller repeat protein [Thermoanaerobaculia bacterium]
MSRAHRIALVLAFSIALAAHSNSFAQIGPVAPAPAGPLDPPERDRRIPAVPVDWMQFSSTSPDSPRTAAPAVSTANASKLRLFWRSSLPETADTSPVYVSGVPTPDGAHDLLIVGTNRGRVIAIDAHNGLTVWSHAPPPGPQYTTASPAVDPNGQWVYAYGLDGFVHKYAIGNGTESLGNGWPELVTLKGDVEKASSALSIATARDGSTHLYITVAGYPDPGDAGDYQGHLTAIDLKTGAQKVFNANCSNMDFHLIENGDETSDCLSVQSGIWARSGVVYDPVTDRIFLTTGNGPYDANSGGFNWGTSIIALRPDGSAGAGTPLDSYTPVDFQQLTDEDADLGSTTVAIIPLPKNSRLPRLAIQSGKDWRLRLVNLEDLSGQGGPRHLGGEIQILPVPQGNEVDTRPATWLSPATDKSWVFVANDNGIAAFTLESTKSGPRLQQRWLRSDGGKTPIIANGVLYFASDHQIMALNPASGAVLWKDKSLGTIHWQSPIIVNGILYISDNAGFISAYGTGKPQTSE